MEYYSRDSRREAERPVVSFSSPRRPIVLAGPPALDGHIKRIIDPVLAICALVFFAPFMATIVVVLLLTDGWPIVFAHERIGRGGKVFRCLKFRTMVRDADERLAALLKASPEARAEWEQDRKLCNDPRITCVGSFLRKTSLDELPQLWNVIRGEMSIVGPRPIVTDEIAHYADNFDAYTSLRPGITGLWQVSGRSDTSYETRVRLDREYAARRNLLLDFSIMLRTVKVVLFREGAR